MDRVLGGISFDKQLSFKPNPMERQLSMKGAASPINSPKTTATDSPRKKESIPLDLATEISSMDGNRRLSLRAVIRNPFKSKQYITADLTKQIANAALAEALSNNWAVVICILDDGGNVMMLERMDGARIGGIQIAQDKAQTAVHFKRPTKLFEDMINAGGKQNYLKMANCLPIEGGVPLFWKDEVIGSIGVSGVQSAQDGQIACAGAAKLAELSAFYN